MANQPRRRILGMCLDENTIRLAEVEQTLGRHKVLNIAEAPSRPPFSLRTLQDPELLSQLGTYLHNIIAERGFAAEEAFTAVNARYALLKRVPYDHSLSQKELQEHVAWELQQYIVSPLSEYSFDFQKFPKPSTGEHPTMLFVALRKKVIEALEKLFEYIEMPLQVVTIDLLAMVNTIEYNYKFTPDEKTALVEIGDSFLSFSVIEGNQFLGYITVPLQEINGGERIQGSDPNTIISYISKQLRFLFSDYWNETNQSTFDHVLITRNSSQISLDAIISPPDQQNFQIVQPFRNIALADTLQHDLDSGIVMAEYIGAIGATLGEE